MTSRKVESLSKIPESCPYCAGKRIVKRGRRVKKFGAVQLWYCNSCGHVFTPEFAKGKTYSTRLIVDALCWYEQGYGMTETLRKIRRAHNHAPSENTVRNWLHEYEDLLAYRRLRPDLRKSFPPYRIISSQKLYHQQVYKYSLHRAKIDLLTKEGSEHERFSALAAYLEDMEKNCPHHLFLENAARPRASKSGIEFDLSGVSVVEKHNNATDMARFVLSTVANNRLRHESLQRFMLACDSVTIATEIPVFLLPKALKEFKTAGFDIPLEGDQPITGHIDFLQIRNGLVHILDYKPDARINRPVEQLTLYALALSHATGIRLYDFKCAWFNEEGYYEFFPLHVVHKLAS